MDDLTSLSAILRQAGNFPPSSCDDFEQKKADLYNRSSGSLTGYDCPRCNNRGNLAVVTDGHFQIRDCECLAIRRSMRILSKSGLGTMTERFTFDTYTTGEPWQEKVKVAAKSYCEDWQDHWFVMSGVTGSGKTHICTAVSLELMKHGNDLRYMLWREDGTRAKACITDDAQYQAIIQPYKTATVLYIDDFWKTPKITDGDINLAYEILNARENKPNSATIISTEMSIDDIRKIDDAIGSRIFRKSAGYYFTLKGDKNQRVAI